MNSILFQGIWCIESVYNPAFSSARNSSAGSKPAAVQCHALSKAWPNQPRRNLPMFLGFLPMFAGYLPMFRPSHPKQGFHMIVGCSVYLYNIHLSIILTINLLYAMQHTHTYNIYIYITLRLEVKHRTRSSCLQHGASALGLHCTTTSWRLDATRHSHTRTLLKPRVL